MRCGPTVLALFVTAVLTGAALGAGSAVEQAKGTPAENSRAVGAAALEESAIRELGVKEGEQVDGGFVFFDGRYLDAPYLVSRQGRRIFINDVMVYQWDRWPLPDLSVDEDPGYPPGLTENSTFNDLINKQNPTNGPSSRKFRYLYQHFPLAVAREKMAEWYRGLPFVESVEFKDGKGFLVDLKMKDGKELVVDISPPPSDSPYSWHFTNKNIVERLEYNRRRYEADLKRGDAVFLFSKGYPVTMIRKKAACDLGLMTEILRSDRTKEEKIILFQRMEILYPPSMGGNEMFLPLITQFQASEQLEERIAQLVKETGVEPRTLKDIPDEHPLERAMRLRKEADKKSKEP